MSRDDARGEAGASGRRPRRFVWGFAAVLLVFAALAWRAVSPGDSDDSAQAPEEPSLTAAGYVDAVVCRDCHAEIWESYSRTGMGRAFYRPRPEHFQSGVGRPFFHEASERYYENVERDGKYFQRRFQIGPTGEKINVLEKEIHSVMGSGNHARTFLHRAPTGKVIELPLAWYSEDGGRWAMSPGYDRPDHMGFQRVISFDCMFCHNAYPQTIGGDRAGERPRFQKPLPQGIDCQRCHGPGRDHVEALQSGNATAEEVRASIVNPARLSPQRQLDVCYQCHLETTSRALPNVTHRYDRGYFSFRPGEPLSSYALYFDHKPGSGWDDKFEINHSAYRLRASACFQQSREALVCTVCHDPHEALRGEEARRRYEAACRSCHGEGFERLVASGAHVAGRDCVSCHMPKRRTDDVVHAVMTDHRIQRRPPARDLLAAKAEKHGEAVQYRGEVVPYYPAESDRAYVAVAQVMQGSNLEDGARMLEAALAKESPSNAEFLFELSNGYEQLGGLADAVEAFEKAIALKPNFPLALRRWGAALSKLGRAENAEQALRRAIELDPGDADAYKELGLHYARVGRFEQALDISRRGVAVDPDIPALHNTIGGAQMQLGRSDEAERAYREAIRLQPDLAEAQYNLANILASRGNPQAAEYHWLQAIRSRPDYAEARYNYAVALAQSDRAAEAERQLRAAVEADPEIAPALTLLGGLVEARGLREEGIRLYRQAVEADGSLADARWSLALALLSRGERDEAKQQIEVLLRLELDPEVRAAALEALEKIR